MENATYGYLKATALNSKKPIYYCEFGVIETTELVGRQTSQNPNVPLPIQFCTAPIKFATQRRPILMSVPTSVTQQCTPINGTTTVGQTRFTILDKDNIFTNMIHNYVMPNRVVRIYGGYQDIPEQDYKIVFTGLIDDIQIQSDTTVYIIMLSDVNRFLHNGPSGSLFDGATSLSSAMALTDLTAYVYGTNGFAPSTIPTTNGVARVLPPYTIQTAGGLQNVSNATLPVQNFILVDDEIMGYTGVTAPQSIIGTNTFRAGTFTNLIRGENLSAYFPGYTPSISTHDQGATINQLVQIGPINPYDLALMLMTSNFGDGSNGPYDLLGWKPKSGSNLNDQNQGAAMPFKYVDVSGFIAQRNQYAAQDLMLFEISSTVSAPTFIANELFTFENAFPVIQMDGKYSIANYGPPSPQENIYQFDDTNTVPGTLQWAANLQATQGLYNAVTVTFDYENITSANSSANSSSNTYLSTSQNFYDQSINATGKLSQLSLPSAGLRASLNAATIINRMTNNLFRIYGFGAQKITFNSFYTGHLVNPGDTVTIKMSSLPNTATGTRGGIPYTCQIINKNINFQTGQVQFVAYATGYLLQNKKGFITPESVFNGGLFPVYSSGNPFQKQYAFISVSGSPLARQLDGSAGSYITA